MMGEGKEERKRDTLLYYIRGSLQGEEGKDMCCKRKEKRVFAED